MEQSVGRSLFPYEKVHHKNGNRKDNRAENLELWTNKHQPTGARVEDLIREMIKHHPETLQRLLAEVQKE